MDIRQALGASRRLRDTLGRSGGYFQQTFQTPLQQLARFSATIVSTHSPVEAGVVTLEQVVFTPKRLESLLTARNVPFSYGRDWTITAEGEDEVIELLEAALSDSIDFYFAPTPKRYQLFADHDEYTTIFGATKGQVAKVATALVSAGFSRVEGYERDW